MTLEDEPFRSKVSNMLLRKSGGPLIITRVQKKQFGQSRKRVIVDVSGGDSPIL